LIAWLCATSRTLSVGLASRQDQLTAPRHRTGGEGSEGRGVHGAAHGGQGAVRRPCAGTAYEAFAASVTQQGQGRVETILPRSRGDAGGGAGGASCLGEEIFPPRRCRGEVLLDERLNESRVDGQALLWLRILGTLTEEGQKLDVEVLKKLQRQIR